MARNKYARVRGTVFKYGDPGASRNAPATDADTVLGNVRAVKGLPKRVFDEFFITNVDDTDKDPVSGDVDNGTIEVTLGMDAAQVATLYALGGEDQAFSITFSDMPSGGTSASAWASYGFIKEYGPEVEGEKGEVRIAVTIRLGGTGAFTPAT